MPAARDTSPKRTAKRKVADPKSKSEFVPAKKIAVRVTQMKDKKGSADQGRAKRFAVTTKERASKDVKTKADFQRAKTFKLSPEYKRARLTAILKSREGRKGFDASVQAPVLKVLEQTTRPLHAIAAAAKEDVKAIKQGKSPVGNQSYKQAWKGLKNEDKALFSDVLKEAGVPKGVAGPAGFVLDVGLDPVTYVSGGTSAVRKLETVKKAEKVQPTPKRTAVTKKEANRAKTRGAVVAPTLAERAAARAIRDEGPRGLDIRFAGKSVPGVTRATAKVGQGVGRATKPVKGVKQAFRKAGSEVNPNIVPVGVSRREHAELRQAARTSRSSISAGVRENSNRAAALRDQIGEKNYTTVIDAIETNNLKALSPELREAAVFFRSQMRYARRLERQAGIPVGNLADKKSGAKGYVPHVVLEEASKIKGVRPAKTVKPTFAKGRTDPRTLREIREGAMLPPKTDPKKLQALVVDEAKRTAYSRDLPGLYAKRMNEGVVARGRSEFNQRIASLGTPVRKGDTIALTPDQAIYHIAGPNLKKLDPADHQKVVDGSAPAGQHVVLNESALQRAYESVVPAAERKNIARGFDYGQGLWKWLATQPNPGFHLRNFFGDAQNAYLAQSGQKLAGNTRQATRALKAAGKRDTAQRTSLKPHDVTDDGVKIGGKVVSYDDLAKRAEKAGAIRSGFIQREIPDLMRNPENVKVGRKGNRVSRAGGRLLKNREDLFRMSTFIDGLKQGLTDEQAVARMSKYHFDYGDLTDFERKVARRVMPFYTFSSRNIPLQIQTALKRPGKYAQYQKVREEVAKAFGLDLDEVEANLPEYEQRGAPMVIKWKGKEFTLGLGPSGLPLTDLNEMPVSKDPTKVVDEWLSRGVSLVTPALKSPVELWANINFFFRDEIEREAGPLVPAPAYVKLLPDELKKRLKVTDRYLNKRTGKVGLGWSAKADYLAAQFSPGPLGFTKRVLTQSDSRQITPEAKALAYAGVRATPVEPVNVRVQEAYKALTETKKALGGVRQQAHPVNGRPIDAENPTPEYTKLLDEQSRLMDLTLSLRKQRGDKIVRGPGRPKTRTAKKKSSPAPAGRFFPPAESSSERKGRFF